MVMLFQHSTWAAFEKYMAVHLLQMQQTTWLCAGLYLQICHLSCGTALVADLLPGTIQGAECKSSL